MPRIYRNNPAAPSITGARLAWVCETPDGLTHCDTRETARDVARAWRADRAALLREGTREQARAQLWEANRRPA